MSLSADNHGIKMLLTAIAIILIGGGATLTYFFAMTAYQVLDNPGEIKLLGYIISQMPTEAEPYTISGNIDNTEFSMSVPREISVFFLIFLGLIALRVVASIAIDLIKGGTKLITAIWEKPKQKKKESS